MFPGTADASHLFTKESTFPGSAADLLKLLVQSPFLTRSQSLKDLPREIPPRSPGYPTRPPGSRWDIAEIAVGSRWDIPSPGDGIEVGFPTYSRLCRSFQNRTRGRTGGRTLCFTGTHTHRSRIGKFRAHRSAHDGVNPIQKARFIRYSPNFLS